jgi:transcription elongation factor Elf1
MSRREELDTNEKLAKRSHPSTVKTDLNRHQLHCRECGGLFYVDDATYQSVRRALEFDPMDNTFACDRCEDELGLEEHR